MSIVSYLKALNDYLPVVQGTKIRTPPGVGPLLLALRALSEMRTHLYDEHGVHVRHGEHFGSPKIFVLSEEMCSEMEAMAEALYAERVAAFHALDGPPGDPVLERKRVAAMVEFGWCVIEGPDGVPLMEPTPTPVLPFPSVFVATKRITYSPTPSGWCNIGCFFWDDESLHLMSQWAGTVLVGLGTMKLPEGRWLQIGGLDQVGEAAVLRTDQIGTFDPMKHDMTPSAFMARVRTVATEQVYRHALAEFGRDKVVPSQTETKRLRQEIQKRTRRYAPIIPPDYYELRVPREPSARREALKKINAAVRKLAYRHDRVAHNRMRIFRGALPIDHERYERFKARGYEVYLGDMPFPADAELSFKQRGEPLPQEGEWIAFKRYRVRATVVGDESLPYRQAVRVIE